MILSSSEAKPCLKKLARFVLYYIHFTLLPQLAAASSLLLVAAATALSLGSQIWFHLNEHVQAAPAPLPGAPQYSQFPASTPSSQTGIQGQMNLPLHSAWQTSHCAWLCNMPEPLCRATAHQVPNTSSGKSSF